MDNMHHSASVEINKLPDNLIEKILMCLPLQEAVRTSVLSTKWRYIWTKLPQLIFNDCFCEESIKATKSKLVMAIYQVLLAHRGPILKFTLSLSNLESCSEIDQMILFVSNNGIKEFSLDIWKGESYKLPSSIFSCQQLENLNLRSCLLKPPTGFKGFSRLVCLGLHQVFVTGDVLSNIISSSPLLERLTFKSSTVYNHLEMVAPNLRVLSFGCPFKSLCFKSAFKLASVVFYSDATTNYVEAFGAEKASNLFMLSGRLPVLEFLELDFLYVKYMAANGTLQSLATDLSHLKSLTLYNICFGIQEEVSSVLNFIRSSQNLEKLKIRVYLDTSEHVPKPTEMEDLSDVSLNHLRKVELLNVSGLRSELEFIKFLLDKSPALEKIFILPKLHKVDDKGLWFFKELTKFRRASPLAEIAYRGPNGNNV